MIFQADMLQLIRERRKDQVRLPVRTLKPPRPPVLEKTCEKVPGRVYKATVAPQRGVRRIPIEITVMAVEAARLGDVDRKAALREGFRFVAQYRKHWETLHGAWITDLPVWVLTFKVGDHRDEFDTPRLLASIGHVGHVAYETDPTGRHHWPANDNHTEDYTDRPELAMSGPADPGEGLTPAQLEPYARAAQERHNLRHLVPAHGNLARIELELAELRRSLGTNGTVNRQIHRDLVRLEKARDAIERRLTHPEEGAAA